MTFYLLCIGPACLACNSLENGGGWRSPPAPPASPLDLLGFRQAHLPHHRLCRPPRHLWTAQPLLLGPDHRWNQEHPPWLMALVMSSSFKFQ